MSEHYITRHGQTQKQAKAEFWKEFVRVNNVHTKLLKNLKIHGSRLLDSTTKHKGGE